MRCKGVLGGIIKLAWLFVLSMAVFYLMYVNNIGVKEAVTWGIMRCLAFARDVVGLLT